MKTRLDLVEGSKHDGDTGGLLDEGGKDASVDIPNALSNELSDGRLSGEAVELLAENHFVERESHTNVYEARCPA